MSPSYLTSPDALSILVHITMAAVVYNKKLVARLEFVERLHDTTYHGVMGLGAGDLPLIRPVLVHVPEENLQFVDLGRNTQVVVLPADEEHINIAVAAPTGSRKGCRQGSI